MIFNLQDSICTLRKDVARIRQKRVMTFYTKNTQLGVFCVKAQYLRTVRKSSLTGAMFRLYIKAKQAR